MPYEGRKSTRVSGSAESSRDGDEHATVVPNVLPSQENELSPATAEPAIRRRWNGRKAVWRTRSGMQRVVCDLGTRAQKSSLEECVSGCVCN